MLKDTVINAFIKHANDNDGVKDNFGIRAGNWPRPLLKNPLSYLWYYHVQKKFVLWRPSLWDQHYKRVIHVPKDWGWGDVENIYIK